VDAFANHFKLPFDTNYQFVTSDQIASYFLPTAPVSAALVNRHVKRLRSSKYLGLDGIQSFIMKGFSDIFMPLLTRIFNLTVSSFTFASLWKQTAVFRFLKKVTAIVLKTTAPFLQAQT
jgi:hypothetical protein